MTHRTIMHYSTKAMTQPQRRLPDNRRTATDGDVEMDRSNHLVLPYLTLFLTSKGSV